MIMNYELERMLKEAVVANYKFLYLYLYLPGGLNKTRKEISVRTGLLTEIRTRDIHNIKQE
jgi:hypothetical protein